MPINSQIILFSEFCFLGELNHSIWLVVLQKEYRILNLQIPIKIKVEKMDRPARRSSLHMIEHKNREQILLYISQAKIQVYSHCIIAYDPKFYMDLEKTYDIAELYKNNQSIQICDLKVIRKSSEEYGQSIMVQNNEIADQQKSRKMSADSEEWKPKQKQYSQLFNSDTMLKQSSPQIQQTQEVSQKIISFNNPDLAFYFDENSRTIQIINLTQKKIELCFSAQNQQILQTIITMFRRKLCEMGFMKKYKIIKLLGKGATADVHLVQRNCDKKLFAAKIISIKNSNQKQFELFVNEAKLLRILKHNNVIHLESVYIHKKQLIQVLEYLPGGNLLQLVKKNQVNSSSQKWRVLKDITTGLQFLRQRRIVHRDLKLENILIRNNSANREFIISDFGLACWNGQKAPIYDRCGTPGYIAPEILNLSKGITLLDHKCDIFSLGVIAHLIFLHQPLFHYKGSLKDLIQRNKKAEFSLNYKMYNRLSMHQLNFLTLTLQKKMEDRPNSEALLKLLNSLSPSTSYRSPQKSKRKISFELQKAVEVQEKKQICLTKKAIKIDLNSVKQSNRKNSNSYTDDASPTRISLVDSARKAMNNLWTSLASPSKKSQKMKLKQNSIQKQRKLSDFLNQ